MKVKKAVKSMNFQLKSRPSSLSNPIRILKNQNLLKTYKVLAKVWAENKAKVNE